MRLNEIKTMAKRTIKLLLILLAIILIYHILIYIFTENQLLWGGIIFVLFLSDYRIGNIINKLSGIKKEGHSTYKIDYSIKAKEIYSEDIFFKTLHGGGYRVTINELGGQSYIVLSDIMGDEICIIGLDKLGNLLTLLQEKELGEYYENEKDYIIHAIKEKENEINEYRKYIENRDVDDFTTKEMKNDIIVLERNIMELRKKLQDIDEEKLS